MSGTDRTRTATLQPTATSDARAAFRARITSKPTNRPKRPHSRNRAAFRFSVQWLSRTGREDIEDALSCAAFETYTEAHRFEGWLALQDWAYGIEIVPL